MTRDKQIVVLHDQTVDRTSDGSGRVVEMSVVELKRLDAGYRFCMEAMQDHPFRGRRIRIPTLEEVLLTFPESMMNIEIKQSDPPLEAELMEVLKRCRAWERALIASKHAHILSRVREISEDRIATSISREEGVQMAIQYLMGGRGRIRPRGQALQLPEKLGGIRYITQGFVQSVHRLGLEIHVWTVNDVGLMSRYVDMGVDGIMTDFPDRFPGASFLPPRQ